MKKTVRMEDVARQAGVSMKTVSRVLNNEPNVQTETKQKVIKAVAALKYLPNPSARSLAGKHSYLMGLVYGSVAPAYLFNIQSGALETCNASHYGLALHPCTKMDESLNEEIATFVRQSKIDGLILTPPISDFSPLLDMLNETNIPYVCISPMDPEKGATVSIDERLATTGIMEHLLGLGHKKIGFVRGPEDHGASLWRYESYKAALISAGIEVDENYITRGNFTFGAGVKAGQYLLDLPHPPTAIFASNDDMAAGVLHLALKRDIKIPAELSIAGFDDAPLAEQVFPSLTTVHQPMRKLGSAAAKQLLELIKNGADSPQNMGQQILDFELKFRESTGTAPKS